MAQGSRQIQSQAQQQIQTLSPQQILVVKLLELPAVELEDRVHAELLENPALEEGKEESTSDETTPAETSEGETEGDTDYDSLSDYLTEDDIPDYKLQENNRSKGEQAEEIPVFGRNVILRDPERTARRTQPDRTSARTGGIPDRFAGRRRPAP